MKKSSIFVTILLVVALCFAVSCQKGPQVSITSAADIKKDATVDKALEDFTFEIEVVNGAFVSDAKGQTLTIKGLDQFNASGTGDDARATATATISKLADADATSKKITKATVTVSGFTAKVATQGAKDLTFEIPEIKADAKKCLEDTTSAVAIGGRKVSITASNPVQKVEVVAAPTSREFTAGRSISTANTVTFTLTGAKWKESAAPTISADNGLTFSIEKTSDTVMTLKVTGTPTEVADAKNYSFVIKDFVDVATGYTLDNTLKASVSVTVKAAAPAQKTDISAPTASKTDAFSFKKNTEVTSDNTITYTLTDGATWKEVSSITFDTTTPVGLTIKPTVDSAKKVLTLTITGTPTTESSETTYSFNIDDKLVDLDATHKLPDAGLKGSLKITVV